MSRELSPSRILYAAAALAAAVVLLILLTAGRRAPAIFGTPSAAAETVQSFADAVSAGDLNTAASCLYGSPRLTGDSFDDGSAGAALWARFTGSLRCTVSGPAAATAAGVSYILTCEGMDLTAALSELEEILPDFLSRRAASDPDAYAADGGWRQEFLDDALPAAAAAVSETRFSRQFTVELVKEDGAWKIIPDAALLSALSGGLTG